MASFSVVLQRVGLGRGWGGKRPQHCQVPKVPVCIKVLIFALFVCMWLLVTLFKGKTRQGKLCFISFRMLSETNESFNVKVLCKL